MTTRQAFPHTGELKRALKLQKYDTKRQIKQHFEGKVGKIYKFAQHFIESTIELTKVLGRYEPDHFTKAYLPSSVFYSPTPILPSRMEVSYCTSGFFVAISPPSNFVGVSCLFPCGLNSRIHVGYRAANHTVTIMCADRAE